MDCLIFHDGCLLLIDACLTNDPECCCDDCCCDRLVNANPQLNLIVRIEAPGCDIDGATLGVGVSPTMLTVEPTSEECDAYFSDVIGSPNWTEDCESPVEMTVRFFCLVDGETCNDYRLTMIPTDPNALGCIQDLPENTNVSPTSCSCGSDTSKAFFKFDGFRLIGGSGQENCECCDGFTIWIEEV